MVWAARSTEGLHLNVRVTRRVPFDGKNGQGSSVAGGKILDLALVGNCKIAIS